MCSLIAQVSLSMPDFNFCLPGKTYNYMKKTVYTFIVSFSLQLAAFSLTYAQPGSLDTTFSSDGKETTYFSLGSSGKALVIQPDGKIVGVGQFSNGVAAKFALARYKTDGTLDSTFGTNGKTITAIVSNLLSCTLNAIALQMDGKLVVAGETQIPTSGAARVFVIARYKTNGTLDSTFGTNGSVIQSLSTSPTGPSVANAVKIQPDGKIIAGGYATITGAGTDFALVRCDSTGTLDTTFGGDGIVTVDIAGNSDGCTSLVIQPDGKIVASGYGTLTGFNNDFAVMRFNTDGSLDNTFDADGIVTTDLGSNSDAGISVTLNSQNKIIVGGLGPNSAIITQYNTNGSPDISFSSDGIQIISVSSFTDGRSVAIQNDDKIVLAGNSYHPTNSDEFLLARLNTDGSLDITFGTNGIVTTDFSGDYDIANAVAIQADGKIVAFGESSPNGIDNDFAIARYNGNCTGSVASSQNPVICSGDGFSVGINTYYFSGIYLDTLTTANGCDSIVTTNLTVNPSSQFFQNLTICDGQSVTVGSNTYTLPGIYLDTLVAANGCDSIITTVLGVNPNSAFTQTLTINSGDSVVVGNSVYTATGVYIDTLVAANGCDSVVTTNLTVITSINESINKGIQIMASPNPFVNWFEVSGIDFQDGDVLTLYDLMGKAVLTKIISAPVNKLKISTTSIHKGMYMLIIKTTSGVFGHKVIQQ